ncbi:MAG: ATP-binding protein [Pseudomonadota bacterium]|nr:ATP-binding protein [Gammaproteobacteria bacterium]MBU1628772.1 ATP-binding protein [Gammaproteobacteria bacterium]MBU1926230.1 ATP-binding protein [Gammaproteobacteria bacterium]MBU2545610.1 ATP-binding protein [Gammaproteobacteria bacterium]
MDRKLLKEIVQEQARELKSFSLGIEREKLDQVLKVMPLPHVVAITGLRRCGKSTLMQQVIQQAFEGKVYYLDFEDERLLDFQVDDFNLLYEIFLELFGERRVFAFDEIQVIPKWETYVRRMYKSGYKFIISGSSADLLSSELSTKLTGRHVAIELLPFSFQEYLAMTQNKTERSEPRLTKERGLLKKAFNQFCAQGGIPEYLQYKNPLIIRSIYENVLYKDVIVRYDIKAIKAIRELSLWLLSNPGGLISYTKLKNSLHLGSLNTIKNYIHFLENAYLIFTIGKYSFSTADQTVSAKKAYVIDTGMMEIIGFQFSNNTGKYLENIVFLALRRRMYPQGTIYYYKTKDDFEVDFCVRKGKKVTHLIQVAEHLNQEKTREREIRALVQAMDELKLSESFIITLNDTETIHVDKKVIHCLSIVDWLLTFETR